MRLVDELRPHPKNRNRHTVEQIERLAKIIEYQGWRRPIRVSNLSGFVTAGHGALQAARLMKWPEVPVDFQDYESSDAEYADIVADNAIASWSELDLSGINADLGDLDGIAFDLELLGVKNLSLEPKHEPEDDEPNQKSKKVCPSCGHIF